MPDHVHFFTTPFLDAGQNVSDLVRSFKVFTARRISILGYQLPIWQREFFDHVLRSGESYSSKWEYVRENPVRAGLTPRWDEWPHQGEIFEIPGALW
jgi:REP element-mobilizing transposase RayT